MTNKTLQKSDRTEELREALYLHKAQINHVPPIPEWCASCMDEVNEIFRLGKEHGLMFLKSKTYMDAELNSKVEPLEV